MKKLIPNTIVFEPYSPESVASAGTLGGLKELVDKLYFTYGSQASFSVVAEEDYGSWQVSQSIVTYRIETNAEYADRTQQEKSKQEKQRAIREAQYLKLKAEFEGKLG